ncbi:MAG: hypothetical protein M0Q51_06420 [Bacteroidales bacterium]|nr:hypothetical protein [Bacteroidales bacterium]
MIDVSIEGKKYLLPENWQEISKNDLLIISDLFTHFYIPSDFLKYALIGFLGIKKYLIQYNGQLAMAKGLYRLFPFPSVTRRGVSRGKVKVFLQEDLLVLSQMLTWIHSSSSTSSNTLTRNLLPRITVRRGLWPPLHLYGPADFIKDVIGIEYAKADAAFLAFCSTADPLYLNDLVGILYRRKKWYWRIEKLFSDKVNSVRMNYTDLQYMQNSHNAFSLSLQIKYAVFLFFQGCRNDLLFRYPYVFSSDGAEHPDSTGWAGVFRALTNENIVDINKVMELPIHTILFDLNEKIRFNKQNTKPADNG